jgi:DNA-directed RNA polymerase II subunit RPB11
VPRRFESFVLGEGQKKITETVVTGELGLGLGDDLAETDPFIPGMSNTSDFLIQKEDHTLGNLLSEHLKMAPNVMMAAYKGGW